MWVDKLNKDEITKLSQVKKVKDNIELVSGSVSLLLGSKPDYASLKILMNNPSTFVQCLKAFEKDKVTTDTVSKLKKYTSNP